MIDAYSHALADCDTIPAVAERFAAAIAPYGITASACGAFLPSAHGPETRFFFQNWPQAWLDLYSARNFVAVDFTVAESRRRIEPFTWNDAKAQRQLSRAERELWDEANAWGWWNGFSVPIHGPGGYFAIVAMASEKETIPDDVRLTLRMLALLTHARCRALAGLFDIPELPAPLTARELECIRWVAAGKTDAEIAAIVEISRATVKTHLNQARRKLGAVTRSQAIARLVLAGLS